MPSRFTIIETFKAVKAGFKAGQGKKSDRLIEGTANFG
jgi:hypothetical protein